MTGGVGRSRAGSVVFAALLVAGPQVAYAQRRQPNIINYSFFITLSDSSDTVAVIAFLGFGHSQSEADTLDLDLVDMTVDAVSASGSDADTACVRRMAEASRAGQSALCASEMPSMPFTYDGRKLRIALPKPTSRRQADDEGQGQAVAIRYHGVPTDGLIVSHRARGGRAYFGDNWPQRARYWLPTVDRPDDKAEVMLVVRGPRQWKVIANGRPVFIENRRRGEWSWWESHPIPTYTMVIGAGEFTVSTHRPVVRERDTIPIQVWAYAEDSAFADSVPFKNATEIVETMERLVGPFPYEKLAHVESSTKFGGMENSSAIFYAERPYVERRMGEGVVRHETAHQWFGDAVTPRHFHHLWLSEGFASYFDLVIGAVLHGDSVLTAGMRRNSESYFASSVVDRPILDTTVTDYVTLLNANNYPKGAWVLHMLRGLLGDSTFFRGIREYYRRYRDSTALSDDFRHMMEDAAGRDLEWFFRQWLRQPGYPQLDVAWRQQGVGRVRLDVTQIQPAAWGRFRFARLTVEFHAADGRVARRVYSVEGNVSVLFADLPFVPQTVTVDPDGALLLKTSVREATRAP